MRKQHITAAVAAAALLLSGCSSLSLNGSDILAPPRAAGDRAGIQKMIEDDTDGRYELICPSEGDFKNGVIMHDLNGDGTEEAIALYKSGGDARVMVAEKQGDNYHSVGVETLSSSQVGNLRFADVDGNGRDEIIISCGDDSSSNTLGAFFTDGEASLVTVAKGFTDYITGDFDGDHRDDILVLIPASAEASAKADLMVCGKNGFESESSCEVDPSVSSYAGLSFGNVNEGQPGALLDGVTPDDKYTTQVLYYDREDKTLITPLFVASGYRDTFRTYGILSTDIDGDGITEFPLCGLSEHGKKDDISTVCPVVLWCRYETAQLAPVAKDYTMLCDQLGFQLRVDEEQTRTLTARCDSDSVFTLHEVEYKDSDPQTGKTLLAVRRYDPGSFDSSSAPEAILYESSAAIYTYTLADEAPFTDETVKNSFIPMES